MYREGRRAKAAEDKASKADEYARYAEQVAANTRAQTRTVYVETPAEPRYYPGLPAPRTPGTTPYSSRSDNDDEQINALHRIGTTLDAIRIQNMMDP